jgi:NADH-quinone oxidoreductase subunit G
LIELPAGTNARGLREVGCLPNLGPGLSELEQAGAAGTHDAAARGELRALYLLHSDPLRDLPDRATWEQALGAAFVVAHDQFPSESIERHADVVFPAESYAEKEGTVTHPDGRIQRIRAAIGRPADVRPEWQLLIELGNRLGLELSHATARAVLEEISRSVPLYRGIDLDEIGARGVRWPERDASRDAANALGELGFGPLSEPQRAAESGDGALRLVTAPLLWASWETERSPALDFLAAAQELQLHPSDAERLGVGTGQEVEVASNDHALRATVRLREAATPGSALLVWGTREESANLLVNGEPVLAKVRKIPSADNSADGFGAG